MSVESAIEKSQRLAREKEAQIERIGGRKNVERRKKKGKCWSVEHSTTLEEKHLFFTNFYN